MRDLVGLVPTKRKARTEWTTKNQHFDPVDFWKALIATAWVTGMRKRALLELVWEDVDFERCTVVSRYYSNKQKRDERAQLGAALPFLQKLYSLRQPGDVRVFAWDFSFRSIDRYFTMLQQAAGIHLTCREKHEHIPSCHVYGWHGFRYAHATYNFGRVSDRQLQAQMGHASFTTTQRYIKYAEDHQDQDYDAYLPAVLRNTGESS